ncbi:MAG: chemotaxis protein MotB [Alphaproteobacteria bacterium]|nr:chemotaxis protein MotB [Alphaproteobacteria bacterium]
MGAMAEIQPIIVKKIKKVAGGHHGGAWKVAYADFVTAMMAFFLLMWLLNATSSEQKMGLAEFFTPTIGIKDSMGIGVKGGLAPAEAGRSKNNLTAVGMVTGQVKQGDAPDASNSQTGKSDPNATDAAPAKKPEEVSEDQEEFRSASDGIKQALREDKDLKDYQSDVVIQDTPEGLKIDIIDDPKQPMFIPGGAVLSEPGKKILDTMARVIVKAPNNISIHGHTDASGQTLNPQYTNWELSADRANSARRFLTTTQLEPERIVKVVGQADRELLTPQEPSSPRNRRITILLVRGSYFKDPKAMPQMRGLITLPEGRVRKDEDAVPGVPVAPVENSREMKMDSE